MSKIRVTSGAWRSRQIQVIDAPGLRPTPDRVRETLFNWLGQDLTGWHCLDLFAGSGILGIECASRGAASVLMIERDQGAFSRLKLNAALFGCDRLQVRKADALEFAAMSGLSFDLVLLDPPYRQAWLDKVAPHLATLARPGMRVYAEAEHRIEALGEWQTVKHGQAGQVFYHLLERA
jgi:16S rRNA (guanine966-N2)-methyltransferase